MTCEYCDDRGRVESSTECGDNPMFYCCRPIGVALKADEEVPNER